MPNNRHTYVRFFPSDWNAGTKHMTWQQRSVYLDICIYCWDHAKPCPAKHLVVILGDLPEWQEVLESLIKMGKLYRNNGRSVGQHRAITEATLAYQLWQQKSHGGKSRAKKLKAEKALRADAQRMESNMESQRTQGENQNHIHTKKKESESSLPSLASTLAEFKNSHGIGLGNGNGMGESKGLRSGTRVTIEDPDERIRRFQAHLVPALGHHAWETIAAATDDTNPLHHEALARCRHAATLIGKGWPTNWPTHERYAP